ncbi:MAG TPA: DUF6134 family protein [Gemmatimonadaceae bacterium]
MRPVRLALVLGLCACASALSAQETVVDEGTLVITQNGAPTGREAYRIVRAAAGGGQAYRATATISFNTQRLTLRLTTDSVGAPLTYETEVRVHNVLMAHVDGTGRPGRFSTLSQTPESESARDYVMGENPLVVDANVFDPYYFAAMPPRRTSFSVIDPRGGTQARFRFEDRGQESIRIGRATVSARHVALIGADGASRDIWVDAQGRLLRVEIPALGLVAQRDEVPR